MLCFEKHRKFYLSSKIFFIFFTLKHGKFRFQKWNCSYRASKSRGNTATEGWERTGTFPLTFTFADKHSGCYGNGLIDIAEIFEFGACSIWIVEDLGRGSFLFPTYLGRSKETLFAGERMHWRNFNLFNGNFRYPSTCTSLPISLLRPVSSVVTERKGSQGPDWGI